MGNSCVQKKAAYEGQESGFEASVTAEECRDARWDHSVRRDEGRERIRRQRYLVDENANICQDQREVDESEFARRVFVPERNEHGVSIYAFVERPTARSAALAKIFAE